RELAEKDAPAPEPVAGAPPPPPSGQPPASGTPPGGVLLAYAYAMTLETPAAHVTPVMKKHEAECVQAGPALCQVLGSSTTAMGETDIRGQLQLRAEPRWLKKFRDGLAGDAKAAGGRVTSDAVTSEDLTRSIVDTEAQLRAQKELRGRLEELVR